MPESKTTEKTRSPLVRQFSVFLENKVGALLELTRTLKDANIHVCGISVVDTADDVASHWSDLLSLYAGGAGKLAAISFTDAQPLALTQQQQNDGATMIADLLPDQEIATRA